MRPGNSRLADGELHVAVTDSVGQIIHDTVVGSYTDVRMGRSTDVNMHVLVAQAQTDGGRNAILLVRGDGSTITLPFSFAVDADGVLWDGSRVFYQQGNKLVSVSQEQSVLSTLELPELPLSPRAGTFDGGQRRGITVKGKGTVHGTALVGGAVFAAVSNGDGAALLNASDGSSAPLPGDITAVGPMTGAPDGHLYLTGWDYTLSSATIRLLQIDSATLKVTHQWDTGVSPNSALTILDAISLFATPDGAVAVGVATSPVVGNSVTEHVWVLRGGTLTSVISFEGQALAGAPARDGSVYLFGGPGGATVRAVALTLPAVPTLSPVKSPAGTRVVAVFDQIADP